MTNLYECMSDIIIENNHSEQIVEFLRVENLTIYCIYPVKHDIMKIINECICCINQIVPDISFLINHYLHHIIYMHTL